MAAWSIGLIFCILLITFIWQFNLLIRDKNRVKEAWSGIDVQLKRRFNLVPNLVRVVETYSQHEKQVMIDVTSARSKTVESRTLPERKEAENRLADGLGRILALSESYPDLKADTEYLNLQTQLVEIEDQIQLARRYFNGSVRNLNIRVESFPSNIIAFLFGIRHREFFEITCATERATPQVGALS